MSKRVVLLLADGFEEVEAVTPIDYLRRAEVEVVVAGIGSKEIVSSRKLKIVTDIEIKDVSGNFDGVIIPGGMPGASNIAGSKAAVDLIKKLYADGKLVAAICASPVIVLENTGIVQAAKITCYPSMSTDVKKNTFVNQRVVVDRNIVTSQGAGTSAEFAFKLIEILVSKESAANIFEGTISR